MVLHSVKKNAHMQNKCNLQKYFPSTFSPKITTARLSKIKVIKVVCKLIINIHIYPKKIGFNLIYIN